MRAVGNPLGVKIPENARILRNLLHGAQYQQDHIVHFYHLHALDWVDIVSALKADPVKTAALSDNVTNAPWGGTAYFKGVRQRLQTFVDSGQLGPFNNAYWGHPAYKLPPEANLMAAAHYIEALRLQAKTARMHAIFGGKNPHLQSLVVGGITSVADLTPDRITQFLYVWKETQEFIKDVYIRISWRSLPFTRIGGPSEGPATFWPGAISPWGKKSPDSLFMPRGVIMKRDLKGVKMADQQKVTEHVAHSWYEEGSPKHPLIKGRQNPNMGITNRRGSTPGLKPRAMRENPARSGPLARGIGRLCPRDERNETARRQCLSKLGVPVDALFSTLGRTAARGLETVVIGDAMEGWIMELVDHVKKGGDLKTYQSWEMPAGTVTGYGLNDVARGSLGTLDRN